MEQWWYEDSSSTSCMADGGKRVVDGGGVVGTTDLGVDEREVSKTPTTGGGRKAFEKRKTESTNDPKEWEPKEHSWQ